MKLLTLFAAALFFLVSPALHATDDLAPDELIRTLSSDVVEILRSDEGLRNGDTTGVVGLIEERVLPHFNLRRMTMLAVGRDWRETTPEQQQQLIAAFHGMLVRTYSNALTQYRGQTVDLRPLRSSPDETTVRVQTSIRQSGAQPIPVDYMMERTQDGWKVFDIVIAGVSLVTNYRGTFTQEIRTGGIDGLIRSMESRGHDGDFPGQS